MGYISNNIANIQEPAAVSLSGTPNYFTIASKTSTRVYLACTIKVKLTPSLALISVIQITAPDGLVYRYVGTADKAAAGGDTFYIANTVTDTAANLRETLLTSEWIRANFEVVIPMVWKNGVASNSDTLHITSKGAGAAYNMGIILSSTCYTLQWIQRESHSNDTISGEYPFATVELDVYADPDGFLGQDDRPVTPQKIGTYLTALQKTYAGDPLWFNVNALFQHHAGHNLPPEGFGWFDTGTARKYRFSAKIKGVNTVLFYWSNVLYVLNGSLKSPEPQDLTPYVYKNRVRLLTHKPRTPYLRGQKEYLNFILSDPQPAGFALQVVYRAYADGERYLGRVYSAPTPRDGFAVVNTCTLDIAPVLDAYPTATLVRVALYRDDAIVSNDLEYTILPECLHTLCPFTFLNALGGWDTFNFDAGVKDEISPASTTYRKNVTPSYKRGDSVETAYEAELNNTFTVEGAPVTDAVAEWLKELAVTTVLLDAEGNYCLIEDFTLVVTDTQKNMQKPILTYRK